MKFHNQEDIKLFLVEAGRLDLVPKVNDQYRPSDDLVEIIIKRRKKRIPSLKNFKKSTATAKQWRKKRFIMMRGIKDFHHSTKGKRMHRAIGRFLSTRDFRSGMFARESNNIGEICEVLKALTSIKTQALIGFDYYRPISEQVDYELFIDEAFPALNRVEKSLVTGKNITDNDLDFLIRLVDEKVIIDEISQDKKLDYNYLENFWNYWGSFGDKDEYGFYLDLLNDTKSINETTALIKSLAIKSGKSEIEVEKIWNKIKASLIRQGVKKDDPSFFARLVGGLKKTLGLSSN